MFPHGIGDFIQPIGILGCQFIIIIIGVIIAIITIVIITEEPLILGIRYIIPLILLEEAFRLPLHESDRAGDMMQLMKVETTEGLNLLLERYHHPQQDLFRLHGKLTLVEQFCQIKDKLRQLER